MSPLDKWSDLILIFVGNLLLVIGVALWLLAIVYALHCVGVIG